MSSRLSALLVLLLTATVSLADGAKDNDVDHVRAVPPPGIKIADADRAALSAGVAELGSELQSLKAALKSDAKLSALLPDVQIYYNAVHYALDWDEIYAPGQVKAAFELLKQGHERAAAIREGKAPWAQATGLVVRGYESKIDGSVQPYGLEIPKDFDASQKHRLDFWFHGRGETLTELSFVTERGKSPGAFHPPDTITLHPYGRYCNANHFAGEIDGLEALDSVKQRYRVDADRIVVRGFSMGGAACWNYAVHYASRWAAAAPGAGFAETPEFLRVFQNETIEPTWYEKKLLHLYDCTDWAEDLYNLPTVAYSGEIDRQRQAATIMAKAMEAEGLNLVQIIGPKMGHGYVPESKVEIDRLIDAAVAKGRDSMPKKIRFTTYTLRYNQMYWIRVDGLEEHWARARVEAEMDGKNIAIKTQNVSRVTLAFAKNPLPVGESFKVNIDGQELTSVPGKKPDAEAMSYYIKSEKGWTAAPWWKDNTVLRKRRYLHGPIDDAFMSGFLMVEPTGAPMNEKVGKWTAAEMEHAQTQWKLQFRGIAPHKKDVDVTDDDIKNTKSLILWGDPSSNAVLKRIADKLPIQWTAAGVKVGDNVYGPQDHVPVLIYPNPLDHRRYVVINSGFTFREYDYLSNARQVPKLPDWAIMDITQPATSRQAAGVVDAGFFDEAWELKKK
ncbi:MAG TPA: prolyl oligopeptidase family serine peptidase [Tepidisphaeraceae bacterium]|jgi:hypothetical protein|nr:prolyl oligopeptidase family serine peptidase [Tepidisphaeraceae bacterium]